ncbi:MAG TPA: cellulase family glycosylhydrolase [Planctomycetota bacterium]|jgi:hypothetical protein
MKTDASNLLSLVLLLAAGLLLSGCDTSVPRAQAEKPKVSIEPSAKPEDKNGESEKEKEKQKEKESKDKEKEKEKDRDKDKENDKRENKTSDKVPDKSEIPTIPGALLDGFEGPQSTVWAFDSADDEGIADYVSDGATQGNKALRITLKGKGAKSKLHLRREVDMNLSQASTVVLDITAPADDMTAALAFKCAPGDIYQEARPTTLHSGLNKDVKFALDQSIWKSHKSNWEYSGPPINLQCVRRIILLLGNGEESRGSFLVDNMRIDGPLIEKPEDAASVYREWRPEIMAVTRSPNAATQFSTMELQVAFRASYRDIFDSGDIAVGARVLTPSDKKLDIRGFFGGLYRSETALVQADEGAAPKPLIGPFTPLNREKDKKGKKKKDTPPPSPEALGAESGSAQNGDSENFKLPENVLPLWLIRFTPQETGRYTLQIYVRNSAGETRAMERSLVVAPEQADPSLPGRKGGNVRIAKRDGRQLELQDGTPFFIVGQNVCWSQDFDSYFDKIKAYGGNTCRVWLCPWGLNLERLQEPGTYDLKEAERIDKLVAKAEATGVRLIFCLTFHGMNTIEWYRSPYNQANGGPCMRPQEFFTDGRAKRQFKRMLSYATARWGASPALLAWELMNEFDLARYETPEDASNWVREMAGHLKGADAHGHLVTASVTNPGFQPEVWQDGRLDFVSIHGYGTAVPDVVSRSLTPYLQLGKPVLLAEFGGGWEAADDIPDKDGARLQSALWLTACSQSCGLALPWWWDTYIEARGLYPVMASAAKFVAGDDRRERLQEYVRKSFGNGVEACGIMDQQGARLYIHNPSWTRVPESRGPQLLAAPAPLELSGMLEGTYKVEFWDARSGKIASTQEIASKEGLIHIELPALAGECGVKVERKARARPELK